MLTDITSHKERIDEFLHAFLQRKKRELGEINPWGSDVIRRLEAFAVRGKTIRGSLAIFSYRMFKNLVPEELIETAAALELFHSAFLIHDDIADRDTIRRRMDAIHIQYQKLLQSKHKGISLAIHVADLAIFLGWELTSPKVKSLVSRELASVCVAQMDDIAGSRNIPQLYRYKTARYTFSLPLMVGATFAGISFAHKLELLGENLGILYQIRDDELDHEKKRFTLPIARVNKQIEELPIGQEHKDSLLELARFCVIRKK